MAGAPVAILFYLLVAGGQKPLVAVLSAGATSAFLYVVLYRLLAVPFPPTPSTDKRVSLAGTSKSLRLNLSHGAVEDIETTIWRRNVRHDLHGGIVF